jgi:spermidine/putrescine transport system permease protein
VNAAVSRAGRRGLWSWFVALMVFLYAPIVVLVIFSFNARDTVSFPWEGFTLRWYRTFIANPTLLRAVATSLHIAAMTSVVTVVLAVPAAIALARCRFRGKAAIRGLLLAPLVIPLIVFAISLQILARAIGIEPSRYSVLIGHVVIALPFALLTLVPRLDRIGRSLEEAGQDLGAGPFATFVHVTLPLLMPAIVSSAVIAFTISFDEVVIASFVAGADTTLPLYLFSQLRTPRALPQIVAVAVLVLALSTAAVLGSEVLRRRSARAIP